MTSFQDTGSAPDTPGWTLCDPRPIQAENPYTFFTPTPQNIDALQPGDLVKLIFEGTGRDAEFVERMWVVFDGREGDICTGRLANEPYDLSTLKLHQTIEFAPHHIIVIHEPRVCDPERDAFEGAMFARCRVDPAILSGKARIDRLERRERRDVDGVAQPDSGWHILADQPCSEDDTQFVAVGVVLNLDDSILSHLRAPVGTALSRQDDGTFQPT